MYTVATQVEIVKSESQNEYYIKVKDTQGKVSIVPIITDLSKKHLTVKETEDIFFSVFTSRELPYEIEKPEMSGHDISELTMQQWENINADHSKFLTDKDIREFVRSVNTVKGNEEGNVELGSPTDSDIEALLRKMVEEST